MIKQIPSLFGFLLIIIGIIGHTYFGHYTGTLIPKPFLFQVLCWIIVVIGVGIIFFMAKKTNRQLEKYVTKWKNELKQNGEKILVNLSECEIKENFYYEEVDKVHSSRSQALNAMIGQDYRNVENQSRYASVLQYKYDNPKIGKLQTFTSGVIAKDKISLGFLLAGQKTTFIYIDKTDPEKYFFDIDFLDQ